MQKIALVLAALMLTACSGGPKPIPDGQKFLDSLGGPKVPTVESALIETAGNYEKAGDFKQAAQIYAQVLQKHPNDTALILSVAECYRRAGELDQALPMFDAVLKREPTSLDAKEGKALTLMAKGDFDTPAVLFEEVMRADPSRWKTLNGLGILFTTRNMQPQAQQYFEAALKAHPDSPSVLNNIGLSQALSRHYDTALDTLHHAYSLTAEGTPKRQHIDLNTALVLAISGKLDDARDIAAKYYSGAELDNNLGLYAHLAKDDGMARDYLNMALSESKTFYKKAWDNLQDINQDGAASPAAGTPSDIPVIAGNGDSAALEKKDDGDKEKKKDDARD